MFECVAVIDQLVPTHPFGCFIYRNIGERSNFILDLSESFNPTPLSRRKTYPTREYSGETWSQTNFNHAATTTTAAAAEEKRWQEEEGIWEKIGEVSGLARLLERQWIHIGLLQMWMVIEGCSLQLVFLAQRNPKHLDVRYMN